MHLSDGALTATDAGLVVIAAGTAVAAVGTMVGLKKIDDERIPLAALLCSAFFVISFIAVPVPPTSAHLMLNGLLGLILGWAAFPAILVALFLQFLIAGFGGMTTLGVNTTVMALPAACCFVVFRRAAGGRGQTAALAAGFAAGFFGFLGSAVLNFAALVLSSADWKWLAGGTLAVHLVMCPVEGVVTAAAVMFLRRVRPDVLRDSLLAVGSPQPSDA
jgi:cobalt/nickel transport system permease protein